MDLYPPDKPIQPPIMLTELIDNCQRLSANLPPDDWTDAAGSPPRVEREISGTLSLRTNGIRPSSAPNQPVSNASSCSLRPATSTSELAHASRACSVPVGHLSLSFLNLPDTPDSTNESRILTCQTNEMQSSRPATANSRYYLQTPGFRELSSRLNGPSSESLVNHPAASTDELHMLRRPISGRYPPLTSRRNMVDSTAGNRTSRLNVPRNRPRTSGVQSLGPTFTHMNEVRKPSPLRMTSTPGDHENTVLLPRGPEVDLPGHSNDEQSNPGFWFQRWFLCSGRRK